MFLYWFKSTTNGYLHFHEFIPLVLAHHSIRTNPLEQPFQIWHSLVKCFRLHYRPLLQLSHLLLIVMPPWEFNGLLLEARQAKKDTSVLDLVVVVMVQ